MVTCADPGALVAASASATEGLPAPATMPAQVPSTTPKARTVRGAQESQRRVPQGVECTVPSWRR